MSDYIEASGGSVSCNIFTCGKAGLVEADLIIFDSPKEGQNSLNKHGSICSLDNQFQIWPQRLFVRFDK